MSVSVEVSTLKEGKYIMIEGEPCRIVSISKSAPGKHGSAKYRIEAIGVFDNKRRSTIVTSGSDVEVPEITKGNGQVIAIMGNEAQIMDLETYETFEVAVPEELQGKLEEGLEVEYWDIEGRKLLVNIRKPE